MGGRLRIGVSAIVISGEKVLLGKRISSHGINTWSPPGGHLEFGESPIECAKRELKEETGLVALECIEGLWTNDFFEQENKHYITLHIFVKSFSGTPKILEPEKCCQWRFFAFNELPEPLFLTFKHLLQKWNFFSDKEKFQNTCVPSNFC